MSNYRLTGSSAWEVFPGAISERFSDLVASRREEQNRRCFFECLTDTSALTYGG